MHEIAGPILFVLETEVEAFTDYNVKNPGMPNPFSKSLTESSLEAHTYWIFEKVMNELEPLYDPTGKRAMPLVKCSSITAVTADMICPTVRLDGQPQVVHFCANIQGNSRIQRNCPLSERRY